MYCHGHQSPGREMPSNAMKHGRQSLQVLQERKGNKKGVCRQKIFTRPPLCQESPGVSRRGSICLTFHFPSSVHGRDMADGVNRKGSFSEVGKRGASEARRKGAASCARASVSASAVTRVAKALCGRCCGRVRNLTRTGEVVSGAFLANLDCDKVIGALPQAVTLLHLILAFTQTKWSSI